MFSGWQDLITDSVYHYMVFFYLCWNLLLRLNNLSFFGFPRNGWTWRAFFFVHEYHDFLICFDASQCCRNCRIRDSISAAIKRRWKIIRRIYKHILASKKFSQSIFFVEEEGFQDQTALSLFTAPKKNRSLKTSFRWHVYPAANRLVHVRIGPIVKPRKKLAYQKRSHISLQLCWMSERAFVH